MILDCHIHTAAGACPDEFKKRLPEAGVGGGIVFSERPAAFINEKPETGDAAKRVKDVLDFVKGCDNVYPFFWIDPMEEDAEEQVAMAAEAGVLGFKVICGKHYPQDDKAMKVWSRIAASKLPILFHSGILYDWSPSGNFNRPCNFEHLFFIDGLRFAMAHISWPWCDELVSVFGKWNYLNSAHKISAEMYVDLTPGTPPIYRQDALTKLLTVDYDMMVNRMIFGTDCSTDYDISMCKEYVARDQSIYDLLNISEDVRKKIFHDNLLNFVGVKA